ncbi:hypothetical protein ABMA27_009218 [Loxostege sticticalis]|uniref:Gustatory receptor n=1 Tax=Loxostege sticticalis TaxID=481309 RepID=A0ABR3HAC2_LOXSC
MTTVVPQEYLLNNFLDDSMQAFLLPLDISHAIFMQSKHTIRYNFITPNRRIYNFIKISVNISSGFWATLTEFPLIFFDITIVYAIQVMKLLRTVLNSWLNEIKVREKSISSVKTIEVIERLDLWVEMQKAHRNLTKAYYSYQKVFSAPILDYITLIFVDSLLFLQTIIEFEKQNNSASAYYMLMTVLTTIIWICKTLTMLTSLCFECRKFYVTVNKIEMECLTFLSRNKGSNSQRETYKNVLRLSQLSFGEMTTYSLFTVDASLPVSFVGVITSYLIVLLQKAIKSGSNDIRGLTRSNWILLGLIVISFLMPQISVNISSGTVLNLWLNETKVREKSISSDKTIEGIESLDLWVEMQKAHRNLSMAYYSYQKVFSAPYYMLMTVLTTIIWICKTLTMLTSLCFECRKFYVTVNKIEMECLTFLSRNKGSNSQRETYKNVLRLSQLSFGAMTTYSLFTVDASLPVSFVSVITSYFIVLLQFAYQK